jgi:hypothetical protein
MRGKDVCYHHGGKSLAGPMAPSFKHGLYSKYLPTRFAELFQALEGRDLLDLTEDIKLLHSRLMDVAKRVDSGESGEKWKQALQNYNDAREARQAGNTVAMAASLNALGELLVEGAADWDAWEKIEELVIKKTKVVESQRKRAVENQEMLTAQAVREMMRAITEGLKRAVEKHVTDTTLRNSIFASASSEFTRLVGSGSRQLAESNGH